MGVVVTAERQSEPNLLRTAQVTILILFEAVQKITLGNTEDILRLIRFRDNYTDEVFDQKLFDAIADKSVLYHNDSELIYLKKEVL